MNLEVILERLCTARGVSAAAFVTADGGTLAAGGEPIDPRDAELARSVQSDTELALVRGRRGHFRCGPIGTLLVVAEPTADAGDVRFHTSVAWTSLRIRSSRPPAN